MKMGIAIRRSAGGQLSASRISTALILLIGILVSQAVAKPQSGEDQLGGFRIEDSRTDGHGSSHRNTTASSSDTVSRARRHSTTPIRSGYTLTPNVGIHRIHTQLQTWDNARKICQAEGGDLAVINSQAESRALAELIAKSFPYRTPPNWFIIGFNDLAKEGEYVTVDGLSLEDAGYAEWAPGNPNNNKRPENCGSMYKDGGLNDVDCNEAFGFACELPLRIEENFLTDESSPFPDTIPRARGGMTSLDQGKYTHTPGVGVHKLHTNAETWTDARSICRSEGGDLAIVNSDAESKALADFMANSQPHVGSRDPAYVHIGFHDVNNEGHYVTVDGKPLNATGFGKWVTREPNDGGRFGNEDCGSLYKDGNLNDVDCSHKHGFICELPILPDVEDFQPGPGDRRHTSNGKGMNAGFKSPDVPNGAGDSRGFVGLMTLFLCTFYIHFPSSYSGNF